jgi:putative endonuclease
LESTIDSTLYTGQTNNLIDRLKRHNAKLIQSTRSKTPYELRYIEIYDTRAQAMHREWQLKKQWDTKRKKKLIASFSNEKINAILGAVNHLTEEDK